MLLAHGPDGALYVVDMYRAVIEHPDFMPPELKDRPDLTLGKDRGPHLAHRSQGARDGGDATAAESRRDGGPRAAAGPPRRLAAHHGPAVAAGAPGPRRRRAAAPALHQLGSAAGPCSCRLAAGGVERSGRRPCGPAASRRAACACASRHWSCASVGCRPPRRSRRKLWHWRRMPTLVCATRPP